MVNEESRRRFGIGPGVQVPEQEAGCQQASPLCVAPSLWGLAPSCSLAGLSFTTHGPGSARCSPMSLRGHSGSNPAPRVRGRAGL